MIGPMPAASTMAPSGTGRAASRGLGRITSRRVEAMVRARSSITRPPAAVPTARTANAPAMRMNERRPSPISRGSRTGCGISCACTTFNSIASVHMPAEVASRAPISASSGESCGSAIPAMAATTPNTANPSCGIQNFRIPATPTNAPRPRPMTTIEISSASLSLVPNTAMAKSLANLGDRSITPEPTAMMRDGPPDISPAKISVMPNDTPAAIRPASAGRASRLSTGPKPLRASYMLALPLEPSPSGYAP